MAAVEKSLLLLSTILDDNWRVECAPASEQKSGFLIDAHSTMRWCARVADSLQRTTRRSSARRLFAMLAANSPPPSPPPRRPPLSTVARSDCACCKAHANAANTMHSGEKQRRECESLEKRARAFANFRLPHAAALVASSRRGRPFHKRRHGDES